MVGRINPDPQRELLQVVDAIDGLRPSSPSPARAGAWRHDRKKQQGNRGDNRSGQRETVPFNAPLLFFTVIIPGYR